MPYSAGGLRHPLQPAQLLAGAASSTSGGMPALAIASSARDLGGLALVPSPSWRWIAAICSRSITSRWRSSRRPWSAGRSPRKPQHLDPRRRAKRETRSSARDQVDGLQDLLLLVRPSRRCRRRRGRPARPASSIACTAAISSSGACGRSRNASTACSLQVQEARLHLGRAACPAPRCGARGRR